MQRSRSRNAVRTVAATLVCGVLVGCIDGQDAADLAVGIAPFEQLRGVNLASLRVGAVRALRSAAEPAPFEGLREPIGAFDVVWTVTGYSGADGSWPAEDALVLAVEASRDWPSDTSAHAAWQRAIVAVKEGLAQEPACAQVTGPGFTMRVAEWDRGGGWSLSASLAPAITVGGEAVSARHSVAVRREALTARYPEAGQPNPDERPTWTRVACGAA